MEQRAPEKKSAQSFGVEKISVGTRIRHALFGDGVILSCRDMGGDVLYEVKFDSGETKRLMATFAKLKKIEE
jgi:DNA helicase-2/ATP-dependent DNA helicase PcrA